MKNAIIYISSTTSRDSIRNADHLEILSQAGIDLSITCRLPPEIGTTVKFLEKCTINFNLKKRLFDYNHIIVNIDNGREERKLFEVACELVEKFPEKKIILIADKRFSFQGLTLVDNLSEAADIVNQ